MTRALTIALAGLLLTGCRARTLEQTVYGNIIGTPEARARHGM